MRLGYFYEHGNKRIDKIRKCVIKALGGATLHSTALHWNSLFFGRNIVWVRSDMNHALGVPVSLVGGKGRVDGEMFHVGLQDVHDIHLAGKLHQLVENRYLFSQTNENEILWSWGGVSNTVSHIILDLITFL